MPRVLRALLCGAFPAVAIVSPAVNAQDRISAAETLLFETDHLKNVAPGTTLSYAFSKTGSAEAGANDTVELRVRAFDGAKGAAVACFSGERRGCADNLSPSRCAASGDRLSFAAE